MDLRTGFRHALSWAKGDRDPAPVVVPGNGNVIRWSTAAAVTAVAGFAAIQSFSHIYWLARSHGQDHLDSSLMPLSVDGLIVAASLVMLHESRAGRPSPLLVRAALWLGIGVTIAANVGAGLPSGPIGALISSWPAVSFVVAVEILMWLIRRARLEDGKKPTQKPSVAEPSAVTLSQPSETPPPVTAPAAQSRSREGDQVLSPSDEERANHLRALLAEGRKVTIDGAMAELKAGRPAAKRALELAKSNGNGSAPHD